MRVLMTEVAFALCVVAGIALVSVPVALIVGGTCGVLACERLSARTASTQRRA